MRRLLLLIVLLTANLFAGSAPPTVADIAALKALAPGAYQTVLVLRYSSADSGRYAGGGLVNWIAGSNKAANACSVYVPNSNPTRGRWERVASSFRSAEQCGIHTYADTISGVKTYPDLAGTGTRMVVVGPTGTTSTQSIPAGGSLANPTGTIGLTAVNGSLTSGLRSDGAPALSQAIAPTWSGVHVFTLAPTFSSTTASQILAVDGSKSLTSISSTGTGSIMRAASPTTTGTFTGASANWTGALVAQSTFEAQGTVTLTGQAGSGTRMLVTDPFGVVGNQTIPAGGSLANPTGTIGLTAVNGSATSGMRSDGAPALSQAIVPTWTGKHTFTDSIVGASQRLTGNLNMAGNITANAITASGLIFTSNSYQSNGTASTQSLSINNGSASANHHSAVNLTTTNGNAYFSAVLDGSLPGYAWGARQSDSLWVMVNGNGGTPNLTSSFEMLVFSQLGTMTHRATAARPSALTSGATITIDASLADFYTLTLATNTTLANPTNSTARASGVRHFTLRIRQDGTGGRVMNYGDKFRFPGGTAPNLSTSANAIDYLSFIYDPTDDRWDFVGNAFNLLTPS